jgi:hypothetical protein
MDDGLAAAQTWNLQFEYLIVPVFAGTVAPGMLS